MKPSLIVATAAAALSLTGCQDQAGGGSGGTRDQIAIVGSSTVFPFAKLVAERFSAQSGFDAPRLESTGTGGGMKLFCEGVGAGTPDIANASRRMKATELEMCLENGVDEVVEVQVGIDGIAIAQANGGQAMALTPKQVYEAIAENPYGTKNTAENWSDIDASLPTIPISVYGPPSTSGTRDALTELIMEVGCVSDPAVAALKESDEERFDAICHDVRADGAYIDAGENDNLIVQKLVANPNSVGIFGYSFLEENSDSVRGISMGGVMPTYDAIASGEYPGARPLYIYVKKAHIGVIPGLQEFVQAFVEAGGAEGYLSKIGLISVPDDVRTAMEAAASALPVLTVDMLR